MQSTSQNPMTLSDPVMSDDGATGVAASREAMP